jgi:ribonuclease J
LQSFITFYGGIHEIGGNKFLVEDRGTRIFLDFGMQITKANQYFGEFLNPRALNGMGDLFEFDLLPKLKGLYRQDYARHTGLADSREPAFDAVVLTHAHMDHAAYLHYIRPDIPVFCSEATKLVMQGLQETGNKEEYVVFKKNFQLKNGVRGRGEEFQQDRAIKVMDKPFKVDSIEIEPPCRGPFCARCHWIDNTHVKGINCIYGGPAVSWPAGRGHGTVCAEVQRLGH